jgi:hypothetical protein
LLCRDGILKEAHADKEPGTAGPAAFGRVQGVGLKDRILGDAADVDGLHGPLQLYGEVNGRVERDRLSQDKPRLRIFGRQYGDIRALPTGRAIVRPTILDNFEHLRIGQR